MIEHCDTAALSLYLDDELPPRDRAALARHLTTCNQCAAELAELSRADEVLVRLTRDFAPIPLSTEARIGESVERRLSRFRFSLSNMVPAALGSTVAAVLVLVSANVGLLQKEQRVSNRLPNPQPIYRVGKQLPARSSQRGHAQSQVSHVAIQDVNRNQPPAVD